MQPAFCFVFLKNHLAEAPTVDRLDSVGVCGQVINTGAFDALLAQGPPVQVQLGSFDVRRSVSPFHFF